MVYVYSPKNRTFRTSCFNSRKLSPVFTGGIGLDEVPPIWVDRSGVKANITENLTRQSKLTYGLVVEEITTRDESSHIAIAGQRVLPKGGISADGPPTTLSDTGIDRVAFLQANITRDNTKFVNGAIVGDRNVFQVITRESLLLAQKEDLRRVMDLLLVKEHHARTLLICYHWNVDRLFTVFVEKGKAYLFAEAGVTVVELEYDACGLLPFSTLNCNVCIEDVPCNETTRMDCGHTFCNN
ncbi:protein TOC75-3, chloroplastic-like isoform X2 [Chenopodium quinoa]|nr:protein TOC75-3, chloroplastic-like isoform X2 [Chenopodium quinoa]